MTPRPTARCARAMLAAALLLGAAAAPAAIPQLLNYQGYLTDDAGTPVEGMRSITFSIYDAAGGGAQLWTETQDVSVSHGLFNVLLGSVTAIPVGVFQGDQQYLALRIGAGPELSPRQRLVSVGHSFTAREAERLDGRASNAYMRSVDGVAPQNGNVDLVAGANVTLTPNVQAGTVTIASSALSLPFTSSVSSTQTALTVSNTGTGYGLGASSTTYAVRATSSGASGYGVYGIANGENGRGVVGSTTGANGYGVWGSSSSHYGVYGSSSTGTGVYGKQTHDGDFGFLGGQGFGVYGEHAASGNLGFLANGSWGVYGENPVEETSGALAGPDGARGFSRDGYGVLGVSTDNDGVRGQSTNASGVHGICDEASPLVAGVYGVATKSAAGVMGVSDAGAGVHGRSDGGPAVYAEGELRVTGAYTGTIRSASATDGAPFPRPAFDSGWLRIDPDHSVIIDHNIGGDPDDYVVDMQLRSDDWGRHNFYVGGELFGVTTMQYRGAAWRQLTSDSITVVRLPGDVVAEQIRVRIWMIR